LHIKNSNDIASFWMKSKLSTSHALLQSFVASYGQQIQVSNYIQIN
jgi:hypothetical protein